MKELERAAYEVEVYENYIERITSIHKDCEYFYDWKKIVNMKPPIEPKRQNSREKNAQHKLDSYKSSFFARMFKSDIRKQKKLKTLLDASIKEDENEYLEAMGKYSEEQKEHNDLIDIAKNFIAGNLEYYRKVVDEIAPFKEISDIGSSIDFSFLSASKVKTILHIHDEKVIPKQTKSLLKSGKLSVKDTPIGKYNELYQDYVCSASLRLARELFALLPIDEILVSAKGNVLNNATGRIEEQPLLSVFFVRETMDNINFDFIDPSECMKNFKHNMIFKKTQGLSPVKEIE